MYVNNFNSIKVQLELDGGQPDIKAIGDFNSIKVQLEQHCMHSD